MEKNLTRPCVSSYISFVVSTEQSTVKASLFVSYSGGFRPSYEGKGASSDTKKRGGGGKAVSKKNFRLV